MTDLVTDFDPVGLSPLVLVISELLFLWDGELDRLITLELSESSEDSVEHVESVSVAGFPERASTPLFNFPCLYSNLYW